MSRNRELCEFFTNCGAKPVIAMLIAGIKCFSALSKRMFSE